MSATTAVRTIKTLSLWQPWASYVAVGSKKYETRHWATSYRGPLAIHAAKRPMTGGELELLDEYPMPYGVVGWMPFGAIVATCRLVECVRITDHMTLTETERALGDYYPGRFAWVLLDVVRLPVPIYARGAQGLWDWTPPPGFSL